MGALTKLAGLALAAAFVSAQSPYHTTNANLSFQFAISDASDAPFDLFVSITAPVSSTWIGFASGGKMTNNPLVVAWPNGNSIVASARWATGLSLPAVYPNATVTVLPSSTVNATHWTANLVCKGCSVWDGGSLNPQGANPFAWALSTRAVAAPANPASSFGGHSSKDHFTFDLSKAKLSTSEFGALVAAAGSPSVAPSLATTAPTTMATSVVAAPPASTPVAESPKPVVSTTILQLPPVSAPATTLVTSKVAAPPASSPAVESPAKPVVTTSILPLPPVSPTTTAVATPVASPITTSVKTPVVVASPSTPVVQTQPLPVVSTSIVAVPSSKPTATKPSYVPDSPIQPVTTPVVVATTPKATPVGSPAKTPTYVPDVPLHTVVTQSNPNVVTITVTAPGVATSLPPAQDPACQWTRPGPPPFVTKPSCGRPTALPPFLRGRPGTVP